MAAPVREHEHQVRELRREAATMALYVSVVLLAELAALPTEHKPQGWGIVALVWGTTIGLALAHWFAFTVASSALAGGRLRREDLEVGAAGVAGALVVALAATVPEVLLARDDSGDVLLFVPAAFLGIGGFVVARQGGRSVRSALVWAFLFMVAGAAVATVKLLLSAH